jgi:hypothetical protein
MEVMEGVNFSISALHLDTDYRVGRLTLVLGNKSHIGRQPMIDPFLLEVLSQVVTPLPWNADPLGNIFSADGKLVIALNRYDGGHIPRDTDARYIVKACNTLPELLKENRDLRNGIRTLACWEEGSIANNYLWTCSACKSVSEASAAPRLYKYCPFCGAKMENEND